MESQCRSTTSSVTAFIGPSGCGKSTFLRTLNRMNETIRTTRVEGEILLDGEDIFKLEVSELRRRVGMVFQRPNPFPKSIFDNIAYGPRINGSVNGARHKGNVEHSLRRAALWDEVKDKLHESAYGLSGGQQQRLCIARALAVDPEVLLLDEPCSALDPIATAKIEDLIFQLKDSCTIVIVTHNMQQAARVADFTGFFLMGEADRIRQHHRDLQEPGQEGNRRLHHGPIRLMLRAEAYDNGTGAKIVRHFEQELEQLKGKLLEMSALVEASVQRSISRGHPKGPERRGAGLPQRGAHQPARDGDRRVCHQPAGDSSSPWRPTCA